jgi:hypothetical protein
MKAICSEKKEETLRTSIRGFGARRHPRELAILGASLCRLSNFSSFQRRKFLTVRTISAGLMAHLNARSQVPRFPSSPRHGQGPRPPPPASGRETNWASADVSFGEGSGMAKTLIIFSHARSAMQSHGWEGAINADMVATYVFEEIESATGCAH